MLGSKIRFQDTFCLIFFFTFQSLKVLKNSYISISNVTGVEKKLKYFHVLFEWLHTFEISLSMNTGRILIDIYIF